jgi:hypothetical protein
MPVNDDMAMVYGRERFGFPKKMADTITLDNTGRQIVGSVVRKGTEILRIELEPSGSAQLHGSTEIGGEAVDPDGRPCRQAVWFLFKHFPSPSGKSLDYLPRLVRQRTLFRPRPGVRQGLGRVVLTSSACDPLADVPVGPVIGCTRGIWDRTMLPGRVWNVWGFLPHRFFSTDFAPLCLQSLESGGSSGQGKG